MANVSYTATLTKPQLADMFTKTVLKREMFTDAYALLKKNDYTVSPTGRFKYQGFEVKTSDYCRQDVLLESKLIISRHVRKALEREHQARIERQRLVEEQARAKIEAIKAVLECIDRGIRDYDNKEKNDV